MSGVRDARNPSDCSALSHSDNRRICGFTFGYAQICSACAPQTSHIPGTLSEIAQRCLKNLQISREVWKL